MSPLITARNESSPTSPKPIEKRHLPVTDNLHRYPEDLQPWGAHASGIAITPDGTVWASWYGGTCGPEDRYGAYRGDPRGASRIYVATLGPSDDGFSAPSLLAGDGNTRYMDANLAVDRQRLWSFYVKDGGKNDTVVYRSTPVQHPTASPPQPSPAWSEEQPIPVPHLGRIMNPPVRHGDYLITPISAFDKKQGHWRDVILVGTKDGGATWQFLARLENRDQYVLLREPCLVSFPDELHMYARVCVVDSSWKSVSRDDPRWRVHRSVSRDGGFTWSAVTPIDVPNYDSKVSVIRYGPDHLLMAYNSMPERFPLVMAASSDRGQTWHDVTVIDPGPGEMSYPTLLLDDQHRLHLTYTWKRREIHYKEYDLA